MRRPIFLMMLGSLWVAPVPGVENPTDLEFRIRFVTNSVAYHAGESIEVEISYSSETEKKYHAVWTLPRLGQGNVTLQISPIDGVVDLRDLTRGMAGSFLSSDGYLGAEPRTEHLDLSDWYRFRKPGHYSVVITSNAVSRMKGADEGGGEERLTLESNALEFDILAADPSWSAGELTEIERVVEHSENPQELYAALHRLAILDTPASVPKLVQLYLAQGPQGDPSGSLYQGLNNSSQTDLVIELLESSLSDQKRNTRGLGADLLAEFQVRRDLGVFPRRLDDPEKAKEWEQKVEDRNKAYEKYFAKANALLLASLERRTGPERTVAIYEAWNNAERQNGQKPSVPQTLSQLRSDVLAIAQELAPGNRVQILYLLWPVQPHAQLKPVVLSLLESRSREDWFSLDEGYKFWCEGWPRECSSAILSDAVHSGTLTGKNAVFLVAEAEHPEFDEILSAPLKDHEMKLNSWESQRTAAVILRAGSRKLQPAVDEMLDEYTSQPRYACELEAYLIGYLFRIANADATKRSMEQTLGEQKPCGSELLRTLHQVRYTDELIPVAIKALNSPNLGSAGTAALFLAQHGPASAEETLWRRIEALHESWSERAAELREAETRIGVSGIQSQAALLEQELVSGLMTGVNWKLTLAEQERLREGCLTNKCREIADGKMSFGL